MPEQHLFEYAVIRVVPRVEREEFINVGIIVYCAKQKFLGVMFELNVERLQEHFDQIVEIFIVLDRRGRTFLDNVLIDVFL